MGLRKELEQRLESLRGEIADAKKALAAAKSDRVEALRMDDLESAKRSRVRISELEARLEDLAVVRDAVQGRLAVLERQAPQAAAVKREIFDVLYPRAVKLYSQIQPHLSEVAEILKQLHAVNQAMNEKEREFESLVGERLDPPCPRIALPPDPVTSARFGVVATSNVVEIAANLKLPPVPAAPAGKVH